MDVAIVWVPICVQISESHSHPFTPRRYAYELGREQQQKEAIPRSTHRNHHRSDMPNNNGDNTIMRISKKNNAAHSEISININEIVCFRRRHSAECISLVNASIPTMYNLYNPNGKRICQYRYVLNERNQPKLCDTSATVANATIAMAHVLQNSFERHDNYFIPTENIFVINGINDSKCDDKSDRHFAVLEIPERVFRSDSRGACNRDSAKFANAIIPSNSLALKHQRFRDGNGDKAN